MVVMERNPEIDVRAGYEAELCVERTEICFRDLDKDTLQICVTVRNEGEHRSRPTLMRIESAPLGAFVPWQPLTALVVPALEPGESRELTTKVPRPHPRPLGDFGSVPPQKVLAALNTPDQPSPRRAGFSALLNLIRQQQQAQSSGANTVGNTLLAPDLWELFGRGQHYWAGNLNVFIGNKAVERHLTRALRIYPERTNLAMFIVGSPGKPDAYTFQLVGLNPDWKAALFDGTNQRSLVMDSFSTPIDEKQWVESRGGSMMLLAMRPPASCRAGKLDVHVTQRSSRKTAIVEFDLDPKAKGSGCYCV